MRLSSPRIPDARMGRTFARATPTLQSRTAEPGVHAKLGAGQPLAEEPRRHFEERFGADFGSVRIHEGSDATRLARRFDARAFALGDRLGFDAGEFSPNTPGGRQLLAHELAHVVQQRRGDVGSGAGPGALDADAERAAHTAVHSTGRAAVRLGAPVAMAFQRRSGSSSGRSSGTGVTSRADTEARVQSEVERLHPEIPWAINVPAMMLFDSNFYGDSGLFDFRGHVMSGGELNNYFIAMAMANQGYSWTECQDMIWLWNTSQYVLPGDPTMSAELWFAASEGYDDEIRRMPPPPPPVRMPLSPGFCFAGDVRVLLADSREVPIRDLELGQLVLAVDEATGGIRACPITEVFVHPAGRVKVLNFSNGRTLHVTSNHPLYSGGHWVPAGTLGPGDSAYTLTPDQQDLCRIALDSVEPGERAAEALYDITVAHCHNFFAEGILAHNKPP